MIDWIKQNPDLVIAASTVTLCIITVVYTYTTHGLLKNQEKQLESRERPNVVVSVVPDELHPQVMNFEIANYGVGVALDVSFSLQGEFPARDDEDWDEFVSQTAFGHGIPTLSPGQKITFFWDTFQKLMTSTDGKELVVECRYESATRNRYCTQWPIAILQHAMTYNRTHPIQKISTDVEKIARSLVALERSKR